MSSNPLTGPASPLHRKPATAATAREATNWAAAAVPLAFVLLWSTGYVAGKRALAEISPFWLLTLRFGLAATLLWMAALLRGSRWPAHRREWGLLALTGLLLQGLQFTGLYLAMHWGLPSGVAALLMGLMPLGTTVGAYFWLGEAMGLRKVLAVALGLLGVAIVMVDKPLTGGLPQAYAAGALGLLGLVSGTLVNKRHAAGVDLLAAGTVQVAMAAVPSLLLALCLEPVPTHWSAGLVEATLWLALVNSIGSLLLMLLMLQRQQASGVARLFFLVPGVSAMMGFVVLGERLSPQALLGFVVAALAVAVGSRTTVR